MGRRGWGWWGGLLFLYFCSALGCDRPELVGAPCDSNEVCLASEVCYARRCTDRRTATCTNPDSGRPVLSATPRAVDFGPISVDDDVREALTVTNLGECSLTIFSATIDGGIYSVDGRFPKEISPGKSFDVGIHARPKEPGEYTSVLTLATDDLDVPSLGIPVRASVAGQVALSVSPSTIDFGYVRPGEVARRTITIVNAGTGDAKLTVRSASIIPAGGAIGVVPVTERALAPFQKDPKAKLEIQVAYAPSEATESKANIVITTDNDSFTVEARGTAQGPPAIRVSPARLDFGSVSIGTTRSLLLTLQNTGTSTLKVTPEWIGFGIERSFSTSLKDTVSIEPGKYLDVPVDFDPSGYALQAGMLNLGTNIPGKASVAIPVSGSGYAVNGNQMVSALLTYENGQDGIFDDDHRQATLMLESPTGEYCTRSKDGKESWEGFGECHWFDTLPKSEPQWITLGKVTRDGTWTLYVQYTEDCSSVPNSTLSMIIGVGLDLLQKFLAGSVIIPGKSVASIIAAYCWRHSGTSAQAILKVNGELKKELTVKLDRRGNIVEVAQFVRRNGEFSIK